MQLYLDWIPYAFGIIEPQRYFDYMMETSQAERILPPWPGVRGRPIPTTEATYRLALMLLVTISSTFAVLTSPKISRKYAHILVLFCAIFTCLPLLQYWNSGMIDTALLLAPLYTNGYGFLVVILIYWRTRGGVVHQVEKQKAD